MKIIPNQRFKHEGETYEAGQQYDVSDDVAEYLITCGWVGERLETGIEQSLDIHDGILGQSSEVN